MRIQRKNILTGKVNEREIDVTMEQIHAWQNGTHIQVAMAHLSADDREFFITGMTPEEWKEVFGNGEKS